MARRSDHSRAELKELSIQAGLDIIKNEGFENFSARKVASSIGYTVGTLYNVFGSYDEMILHINACTLDAWFEIMQKELESGHNEKPIHALAQFYLHYSKEHYNEWLALFEYHMSNKQSLPEWYAPKMIRFYTMVERLLLPIVNEDEQKAKRDARILWAGIHGISILSLSGQLDLAEGDTAEILANAFIDNYLAGLTHIVA